MSYDAWKTREPEAWPDPRDQLAFLESARRLAIKNNHPHDEIDAAIASLRKQLEDDDDENEMER